MDREELMHSDGTSALETLAVITPTIMSVVIATTLVTLLPGSRKWQFAIEFLVLILPAVLNMTVLSTYIGTVNYVVFILCILLLLVSKISYSSKYKAQKNEERRIPFITNARATINFLSVLAILAVDFQIFPRRFAKTSTFGFSLMDLGVGLYIFANSLVSPECLNKKDSLYKILKSCIPLFMLGMLRLLLTKQIDYHVPVLEYGIHWNFFFTLLFTKCIGSLIIKIAHVKYMQTFSIVIVFIHEFLLQYVFIDIVMSENKRDNFFLANIEGIVSILGYVSLYVFTVYFGYILNEEVFGSLKVKRSLKIFFTYLLITGISAVFSNAKLGTSRRLVNLSYCLWVVFVGLTSALLFYAGEIIQLFTFGKKSDYVKAPYIFQSINFNALVFFLLGNLFTGIINMICDTLTINNISALLIILCYAFTLTLIMCFLYERKIKFKL
ncbi:hypothetical protein WA026_000951 [Henosepilachna vigintioctopunctata]|uniref:Phosphatidylinositol-glycan biosynthesis class W protein n=1 Tax=Henosepilachna vigintioctopunctata TaxID=420089 RepID=A0AAW1V9N2_9CUCU